ncbi:MAG: hypothetical protein A2V73_06445, partial [candidate division Zixibacteria bacterium RBG_19FT_COMBO_42_43]
LLYFSPSGTLFNQAFISDKFGLIFKIIFLASGIFTLSASKFADRNFSPSLILIATGSCMVIASAGELLTFLACWGLLVVCLYSLVSQNSSGLSFQFLILQLVSVLIFILGAALIFGMTGASSLSEIKVSLVIGFFQGGPPGVILVLALVLILVSLSIQLSVFPFHTSWVKLYQEIPTPLTAFFNISVKLAFLAFLFRLFIRSFLIYHPQWIKILAFLAGISMLYGAIKIFKETDFKKTLNSLAIFQIGLILIGIVTGTEQSLQASIFFIWAYFFSSWGIYAWLVVAEKNKRDELGLAGIFRQSKILAVALTILFFSLAGLPFTAGFWGRVYLLESGWSFRRFTLTIVGVITSLLAIIYFWNWIKKIFTSSAYANSHLEVPLNLKIILFICFLGSLFLGVYPQVFNSWALQAVKVFPF